MARNPPDPEMVRLVLEQAERGVSYAELSRVSGLAESTVRAWVRKYGPGLRTHATPDIVAALLPQPQHTVTDPAQTDGRHDTLEEARRAHREQMRVAAEAARVGNMSAAQRALRDASALLNTIARLEKTEGADADVLRISRAEIAEGRAAFRARVAAILSAPQVCAKCGHAIRVAWTAGDES